MYKMCKHGSKNINEICQKWIPMLNQKRWSKQIPKNQNILKKQPNSMPKNVLVLGVVPRGHPWRPNLPLEIESVPPTLPRCFQSSKTYTKRIPKSIKIAKKTSKGQGFSGPGLADCCGSNKSLRDE